jgi:hypothetical protein
MASSSLLGLYGGGSRRSSGDHARQRSASSVRKMLLKSTWQRNLACPRHTAVSFGYDLHSYSQNIDDGVGFDFFGHHHRFEMCGQVTLATVFLLNKHHHREW